jgi:hypothetical protein
VVLPGALDRLELGQEIEGVVDGVAEAGPPQALLDRLGDQVVEEADEKRGPRPGDRGGDRWRSLTSNLMTRKARSTSISCR